MQVAFRAGSHIVRAGLLAASLIISGPIAVAGAQQDPRQAALSDCQLRIHDYITLRWQATANLPPIPTHAATAEVHAIRLMHARAVREAREGARAGDIITPAAGTVFRAIIADTLRQRQIKVVDLLAELRADAPGGGRRPHVNDEFPWVRGAATPYALIVALPKLPGHLEYRFLDRDLVLLDVDLEIIIDILPDALPKH